MTPREWAAQLFQFGGNFDLCHCPREDDVERAIAAAVEAEREAIAAFILEQVGNETNMPGVRLVVVDELAAAIRASGSK